MADETRVTIREDAAVAMQELETRFALATRQRELLENYIKSRLKPQQHFYTVDDEPGRKPSLAKEGAELICLPHGLKPHYAWLSGPDNPPLDDAPYQITMQCELETSGKFGGGGVGSASSMVTKKDGTRVQRQKDPGLRHNATVKMACKSAYIAATLNATAASEFFTQDLEDDQSGSEQPQPGAEGHWCKAHNVAFFKKGNMRRFAHPIGDTGKWCNEPHIPKDTEEIIEGKATVVKDAPGDIHGIVTEPPKTTPEDKEAERLALRATIKNVGNFLKVCSERYNGMLPATAYLLLGVKSGAEIADAQEAFDKVWAAKEPKES